MHIDVSEQLRPKGDFVMVAFDARDVQTYDQYRALLRSRELLTDGLAQELVRERVAQSWRRALSPRTIGRLALPRSLWRKGNLVCNAGKSYVATALATGTSALFNLCAVGSSSTPPTPGDTGLNAPINPPVSITAGYVVGINMAVWDTFFSTTASAGSWNEAGLIATSGVLASHALLSATFTKTTSNTVVLEWKWTL